MPMMTVVAKLNVILSGNDPSVYDHAKSVVESAPTVAAAVAESGVYAPDPAAGASFSAQVAESRAVFGAIPPAVDQAILAALRSAFDRHAEIRVAWVESFGPMQVHVTQNINHDKVVIHLSCPSGETFH